MKEPTWKFQNQFPMIKVLNYGTSGYGTCQQLLLLERALPICQSPIIVLYGFVEHHEIRNITTANWLAMLAKFPRRGHAYLPYATIDKKGEIRRHPPERHPIFPFRESLATITILEKYFAKMKARKRTLQRSRVTEKLLLEMNDLSRVYNAKFVVAMLLFHPQTKAHYLNFFKKNGIQAIDCVYELTPERQVKGEGHPNGIMNSLWTNCIIKGINNYLN